jgi:hypothetical protein
MLRMVPSSTLSSRMQTRLRKQRPSSSDLVLEGDHNGHGYFEVYRGITAWHSCIAPSLDTDRRRVGLEVTLPRHAGLSNTLVLHGTLESVQPLFRKSNWAQVRRC